MEVLQESMGIFSQACRRMIYVVPNLPAITEPTPAEMVRVEVLMYARDMFKNIGILCGRTDNEAELRFAYGNPIVSMLYSVHGYFQTS